MAVGAPFTCCLPSVRDGGGPKRFGPGVPARKPSSMRIQIAPIIGMSTINTHQPDLSLS